MTIAKRLLGLIFSASLPFSGLPFFGLLFSGLPFVALPALGPSVAHAQTSQAAAATPAEGDVAGISYFYDALNDDGGWVEHPRYGQVWQPDVDDSWRPYTVGRWVNSETYGWTWLSDEPFGWAVYHYGRWSRDPDFGWIWVPGSEWAPAWVLWRYNDEAIGWAPMPPETRFEHGRVFADPGVYESRPFLPRWVFASPKSFTRANVSPYVRPVSWNRELIGRTRSRLSYDVVDNRVVNRGVPVDELQKMLRGPVPHATIKPVDADAARRPVKLGEKADGNLGDVELYRPELARTEGIVRNNPAPRAAGKAKHRGEFGRLPPQRRERLERDDRQMTDDTRRPRRPDDAARDDQSDRPPRAAVRDDDQGPRDRDGDFKPWHDPDASNRDGDEDGRNNKRKAARPDDAPVDATIEEPLPPRGADAPRRKTAAPPDDVGLPADDPPPANKPGKKRNSDTVIAPETMPEPELIDPAPGKKSGKPVEYYEEVPPDDDGAPGAASPPGNADTLPTEGAPPKPGKRPHDRPGRIGNSGPFPEPERAIETERGEPSPEALPAEDTPKRKAPAEKSPPKSTAKPPVESTPEKASEKSKAKTKPAESGTNLPPRKRAADDPGAAGGSDAENDSKTKVKRRWDQNGTSGYPTVVGPDGAEQKN